MNRIAEKVLDESFSTELTGASRDYAESSSNAYMHSCWHSLLFIAILAANFESFIDPFIIMLTVPLALGGAVSPYGILI